MQSKQLTRKQAIFRMNLFLTGMFLVFSSFYPLTCWERGWTIAWYFPAIMFIVFVPWMIAMNKLMALPNYMGVHQFNRAVQLEFDFDLDEKKDKKA